MPKPTSLFHQIKRLSVEFGARLVILDSLHDLFAGNENSRPEARGFVNVLRQIALAIDGAVLLNAHPSMSGLTSGSGSSGSTAWNNAVRSRLYLKRPDDVADSDARILDSKKSNYGPLGSAIEIKWKHGVFVRETTIAGDPYGAAQAAFLACLDAITEQGRYASHHSTAAWHTPLSSSPGCSRAKDTAHGSSRPPWRRFSIRGVSDRRAPQE